MPFDLIFCIGVLEYSKLFVGGADPWDSVLRHFAGLLAPGGAVVWRSRTSSDSSTSRRARRTTTTSCSTAWRAIPARTCTGLSATRSSGPARKAPRPDPVLLPYPDYKLPSCVLSEEAFRKLNLAEMIGNYAPRDYSRARSPVFDQRLVLGELARNDMLHLFANSFLAVAADGREPGSGSTPGDPFQRPRRKEFQTVTTIESQADGKVWVRKRRSRHRRLQADVSMVDGEEAVAVRSPSRCGC